MWIIRLDRNCEGFFVGRSSPPASSNSTFVLPSALSRLASTQPALPAPTTM